MALEGRVNGKSSTPHSKYPEYQIIQLQGGHRIEIGNEAGKECFKIFTAGGSSIEFQPDGSVMQITIGDAQQYFKGGKTETVDENSDTFVNGHSRTTIAKGKHEEIAGDSGSYVAGKTAMYSKGAIGIATNAGMSLVADGAIGMNASKGMKIHVKGDMELNVTGALSIKGDGGIIMNGQTVNLNKPGEPTGNQQYTSQDVPVS